MSSRFDAVRARNMLTMWCALAIAFAQTIEAAEGNGHLLAAASTLR